LKPLTSSQLRHVDQKAKDLGLDERLLIENASSNLYSVIDSLNLGKKVVVVSGRGNNGADVLSCSRKLLGRGYEVRIFIIEEKPLNSEALFQKGVLGSLGQVITVLTEDNLDKLKEATSFTDFILEGIFGIGLKGTVTQFMAKVIGLINDSGKTIVSCDIPSGLSPDTGEVLGAAIKADHTVSFIAPKQGFSLNQGPNHCGQIFVVDIGVVI